MKISIRFTFNGKGEAALNFYTKVLDGKIESLIRYKDVQDSFDMTGMSEKDMERIMNSCLYFGDTLISICDQFPGETVSPGNSIMMNISISDPERLRNIFNTLAEDGSVIIPLAPASWTPLYGLVTDKFGISWNILLG